MMVLATSEFPSGLGDFLQYGSFGLNALLLIWFMWKGAPTALEKHEKAIALVTESSKIAITKLADDNKAGIDRIVCAFEKDSHECRSERIQNQRDSLNEREAERKVRTELAASMQMMASQLEAVSERLAIIRT